MKLRLDETWHPLAICLLIVLGVIIFDIFVTEFIFEGLHKEFDFLLHYIKVKTL